MSEIVEGIGKAIGGFAKSATGAVSSLLGALMPKPPVLPPFPSFTSPEAGAASQSLLSPADPSNGTAQAERDAAADEERKRLASARGFAATNPTGGAGDLSQPNLATKSLLGQ